MAKGGAMVIGYTAVGDYLLPNISRMNVMKPCILGAILGFSRSF